MKESEPQTIPGRIDRPIRHTNTRPQTVDDGHRYLQVSCESIREVIGEVRSSLQRRGIRKELLVDERIKDDLPVRVKRGRRWNARIPANEKRKRACCAGA